jgi:adenosylhomocysteine nucleosidase
MVSSSRILPLMPIPPEAGALPSILIVAALPEELDHPGVLPTVLGKLNAAYALTRELQRRRPKLVVNYGTAGGLNPSLAGLVEIRRVLQVDMESEPLAPRGQTPFSPEPFQLDSGTDGVVCGSGDSFVTATDPWLVQHGVEVVDMELFAIASVCQREGIPWRSFKYISDHADRDSETRRQAHVRGGRTSSLSGLGSWLWRSSEDRPRSIRRSC